MENNEISSIDICILGAGMVGLSLAYQILERFPSLKVTVIEKEPAIGFHSSGRNSGVLHAGLYYDPQSLKAKVCVSGARRLRAWCEQESLPVLSCGKVVTPQKASLDSQLEVLMSRGTANGATVELIDEQQFRSLVPDGYTSTGRAIWSPDTCVVKPALVIQRLEQRLKEKGVNFIYGTSLKRAIPEQKTIYISDGRKISYGHLFNCTGLHSDKVAQQFGLGDKYTILPFRGTYWQLKKGAPFRFDRNLYPVPDLDVPFLGVHVTPSVNGTVYLGPTAIPAFGRENYVGAKDIEANVVADFVKHMSTQFLFDKKIRKYVYEQAFQWLPNNFLKAARAIVPKLEMEHIEPSKKVGIRPQLYDIESKKLVDDFVMINAEYSTHIVNAISPAFTASFSLADLIIDRSIDA